MCECDALLATLDTQGGTINICRWSPCSQMLALGDDFNIYIYMLNTTTRSSHSFGSKHVANKENWARKYLLQGHSMDITDLTWSPIYYPINSVSSLVLASSSIDNKVNLWSIPKVSVNSESDAANNNPVQKTTTSTVLTPWQVLNGHQSFVKGVCFDPIGRYICTVGSDSVIILWENKQYQAAHYETLSTSTLNFLHSLNITSSSNNGSGRSSSGSGGHASHQWVEVHRLNDSIVSAPDKCLFRRGDWSPDGACVCISNCLKENKPIGMIYFCTLNILNHLCIYVCILNRECGEAAVMG